MGVYMEIVIAYGFLIPCQEFSQIADELRGKAFQRLRAARSKHVGQKQQSKSSLAISSTSSLSSLSLPSSSSSSASSFSTSSTSSSSLSSSASSFSTSSTSSSYLSSSASFSTSSTSSSSLSTSSTSSSESALKRKREEPDQKTEESNDKGPDNNDEKSRPFKKQKLGKDEKQPLLGQKQQERKQRQQIKLQNILQKKGQHYTVQFLNNLTDEEYDAVEEVEEGQEFLNSVAEFLPPGVKILEQNAYGDGDNKANVLICLSDPQYYNVLFDRKVGGSPVFGWGGSEYCGDTPVDGQPSILNGGARNYFAVALDEIGREHYYGDTKRSSASQAAESQLVSNLKNTQPSDTYYPLMFPWMPELGDWLSQPKQQSRFSRWLFSCFY